ncbi:hypothetical protein M0Q28_06800 [Patescibacteria group bacterium]|jgi:hypothetical protein|nr:hypothetical protein [Patescibacteria group bacterium]
MEKPTLRLFLAAAFVAALTGCPGPQPGHDTGTPPPDSGTPDDGGSDPVDAGTDAYVPPGDGGTDSGVIPSTCDDVEYVGTECNLPEGMAYNRDGFICASFINNDLWVCDTCSTPEREGTIEDGGILYSFLRFARANTGMYMPAETSMNFTCGPEGRCWLNWFNPVSNYSHCRVTFNAAGGGAGCDMATTECWMPGSATPVTSSAIYIGE